MDTNNALSLSLSLFSMEMITVSSVFKSGSIVAVKACDAKEVLLFKRILSLDEEGKVMWTMGRQASFFTLDDFIGGQRRREDVVLHFHCK